MDLPHVEEEEIKKEHGLEPATPAKLIPPRPFCVSNVTGFMKNSNVSTDSVMEVCIKDGEDFLNLETTCKDQENLFDTTPLKESDSSTDCQLSSGLPSSQNTCSEDGRRRAVIFNLFDNVDIRALGFSERPISVEFSVLERYHVHPHTESLQEGLEGGKTVGGKSPKSIIKRQRVKKPIAKRYRPKIQDNNKPQKIIKSKDKRNSSDTVGGIQPGKKRKYVKRSLTELASSKIPMSEIGNSQSLSPNTPGSLILDHTPEPLISDHTPETFVNHISIPEIKEPNKFQAKSCRRSLDFSMNKNSQNVDLSEGQPQYVDFSHQPHNVALSHGEQENKVEKRVSFKWDVSWNLPPQDFEYCVELKTLINQHIHEKKCNINLNSRSQGIHNIMSNGGNEMKFSLVDDNTDPSCEAIGQNIRKFDQNGSAMWKKMRLRRRRRVCYVQFNDMIAEMNRMIKVNINKQRVNKRTETLRRSVDSLNGPSFSRRQISRDATIISEDFSITPLFDCSSAKRKRSSRSFVRNSISLPLMSPPAEASVECIIEAEGNYVKCTNVEGCYPKPDAVLQISCPKESVPAISKNPAMLDSPTSENNVDTHSQNGLEEASAKPLINSINQEVGTPLIGDDDIQKMVLYQNKNNSLVQYREKKPRAEVDLDPDIIETWRLLTENGERTTNEVKESEKLRKQREIFRSRAEAFIATMREFLGNRRFTPWKGSVIDSLVGTFLTQNVSDHLSSSAFMSLRARYPPKHKGNDKDEFSSVQKGTGFHEQTHDFNSELSVSNVCETRPHTNGLSTACIAGPRNLEKRDILRENLEVEANNFLEQYYDHRSGQEATGLVERHPSRSSLEEVVNENSKTERKLGTKGRKVKEEPQQVDWDQLRKTYSTRSSDSTSNSLDSVDWEAVRQASLEDIEATIQKRGQQKLLSKRIKELLERLVKDHGSTNLEWLRDVPPDKAKEFLLSINGLGLKSVECIRLLTLHHKAFPVDTNVARIAVRLGWVPLKPLPKDIQFHVLFQYPSTDDIQKYLWPSLCTLDQETLYEFHYQLITFGKVFCPKISPNCSACPKKAECRHKASKDASDRLLLPGPQERSSVSNSASITHPLPDSNFQESVYRSFGREPIVEFPSSPELAPNETPFGEAEDPLFSSEGDEMHYINLNNMADFSRNFLDHSDEIDYSLPLVSLSHEEALKLETEFMNLKKLKEAPVRDIEDLPFSAKQDDRDRGMTLYSFRRSYLKHLHKTKPSQALVAISPEKASKPNPKLKYADRLRTEHQVYELPDGHPVLANLNVREVDDPSPYLFAIFETGESSISSEELRQTGKPQDFTKSDFPEVQDHDIVYGTILHPCKTALNGNFPLNGTYFQVNEVFVDFASSISFLGVPRSLLWDLPRRILYCGTSAASIIKGSSEEEVKKCFFEGFICVRGYVSDTGAPRHLPDSFHHMPLNKGRKPDEWWG